MADRLKLSKGPRATANLAIDPLRLLKQSLSGGQLHNINTTKQIPFLTSQIQQGLKQMVRSPRGGTIFDKGSKSNNDDLCKKLLTDNRQANSTITKLENTITFLVELLNEGESVFERLVAQYSNLKKAYLEVDEFQNSFISSAEQDFRARLVKQKIYPFPDLKKHNISLAVLKNKPKPIHFEELLMKSKIKEVEKSRFQDIEQPLFCQNCKNTKMKIGEDINHLLDVSDSKNEASPPIKRVYKAEKTNRILLTPESEEEKKNEDGAEREKKEFSIEQIHESFIKNSTEIQGLREIVSGKKS